MTDPNNDSSQRVLWRKQDWAYEEVRARILSHRLNPGERIDQEKLAAELGISRIPLRQGLGKLISEGLIQDNPHRQWVVTELTKGDVRDIYSGREALEALLAAEATLVATDLEVAEVKAALDRQDELLAQGAVEDFRAADRAFHDIFYQAAQMPKTYSALNGLLTMSERYIHLYQSDPARVIASLKEHHEIYDAIVKRDRTLVSELVRQHVVRGRAHLESLEGDPIH